MTVEYRGQPVKVDHSKAEESVKVRVPLLLRPVLKAHMGSDTILIENRYVAEGRTESPRVIFYKDSGNSREPASPRSGASFILFGKDINKDIYCRILGVKYIPPID